MVWYFQLMQADVKVENILKGKLDSIPSRISSAKIQIMGGKVCLSCRGWTKIKYTWPNFQIGIFQKVYEWSSCPLAKMIVPWGDDFSQRTAWSLIYFWNYVCLEIWPSVLNFCSPSICLSQVCLLQLSSFFHGLSSKVHSIYIRPVTEHKCQHYLREGLIWGNMVIGN